MNTHCYSTRNAVAHDRDIQCYCNAAGEALVNAVKINTFESNRTVVR